MLALILAVALLVPAAPAAATKMPGSDAEQIRAAFETAFDGSRALGQRARSFRHTDSARSALLTWPDVRLGVREDQLRARVTDVQVAGDAAEVHFELTATGTSFGELLPFGVAVRHGGTWKVSRHTLCAVTSIVGGVCRNHPPVDEWRTYWQGTPLPDHRRAVPITFADATSVELGLPDDVATRDWYVTSNAQLRVGGTVQAVTIVHGAERVPTLRGYDAGHGRRARLDFNGNLNFRAGRWTVRVEAAHLSQAERALVARGLRPRVAPSGMVALETGPQLALHRSTPDTGGSRARKGPIASDPLAPVVQVTPVGGPRPFGALSVAHTGCSQATLDRSTRVGAAPSRCFEDIGVELSVVGGDPDALDRLVRETTVELVS